MKGQDTQFAGEEMTRRKKCPECGSPNVIHQAATKRCLDCGWSFCPEG